MAGKAQRRGGPIPIEIVPRHVHLSQAHLSKLFGQDHTELPLRDLSLRGQFVSQDSVDVVGPQGTLPFVRVLGPCRMETQIELTAAEAASLGIKVTPRLSGDLAGSGSCRLVGPAGSVTLRRGVIVPLAHVHLGVKEAKTFGVRHGDEVTIRLVRAGQSELSKVVVRVHPTFRPVLHVTADDAALLWLEPQSAGYILG